MTPDVVVCLRCGHSYRTTTSRRSGLVVLQNHSCSRCGYVGWAPLPRLHTLPAGVEAARANR